MAKETNRDYASEIAELLGFDPNDTVRVVIDLDARHQWDEGHKAITVYQVLGPEKFDALKAAIDESHRGIQPISAKVITEGVSFEPMSNVDRMLSYRRDNLSLKAEIQVLRSGVEAIQTYVKEMDPHGGGAPNPTETELLDLCGRVLAYKHFDAEGRDDDGSHQADRDSGS